jgi:hypothetical protein
MPSLRKPIRKLQEFAPAADADSDMPLYTMRGPGDRTPRPARNPLWIKGQP